MTEPGEILIVIPARGGSKRLPRKNVLPLMGKPLICWTIEAALETGLGPKQIEFGAYSSCTLLSPIESLFPVCLCYLRLFF